MNFKGFDEWIEIFRGGKQADSNGVEHDGDELIDRAVKTFDASEHEPPVVIGHPQDNAPAYGWVEGLKTTINNGIKILLMKARDVVPEFEEMVKKGLFKKRSASFYRDGRLRHVGFLGAAPPAVKGLADLKFEDDDEAVSFDFYDPHMGTIARIFRNLRDHFIETIGKEKTDSIIPDWDVDYIRQKSEQDDEPVTEAVPAFSGVMSVIDDRGIADKNNKEGKNMSGFKEKVKGLLSFMGVDLSKVPDDALPDTPPDGTESKSFTEADLAAAVQKAEEDGRKKAETEFAEKTRKSRREKQEKEIAEFCESRMKEGKLLPAWEKMGLKEFMLKLDGESVVEFAEGTQGTSLDWFKNFLEELPKVVEFKEIAVREDDVKTGSAGIKLEKIIRAKMKEDKSLDYGAAFAEAQRENPELAQEYASEKH